MDKGIKRLKRTLGQHAKGTEMLLKKWQWHLVLFNIFLVTAVVATYGGYLWLSACGVIGCWGSNMSLQHAKPVHEPTYPKASLGPQLRFFGLRKGELGFSFIIERNSFLLLLNSMKLSGAGQMRVTFPPSQR